MTIFMPEMPKLLQAAADYLENQLLPTLNGYHRFQTRVCVNVLRILQRQAEQRALLEETERARLRELLQSTESLELLNKTLASRIDDGSLPLDMPTLVEHLQATLQDTLAINNPKWIAENIKKVL